MWRGKVVQGYTIHVHPNTNSSHPHVKTVTSSASTRTLHTPDVKSVTFSASTRTLRTPHVKTVTFGLHSVSYCAPQHWSARRSSLKGRERAIVNQVNIGTVSKATLGKLLRHGVERIWTFPSAFQILNWPEWSSLPSDIRHFKSSHTSQKIQDGYIYTLYLHKCGVSDRESIVTWFLGIS